ncbi:MAG: hydantoinase/oxoprolinase family protein, partial [Candidatus Binatia bacterium]|nr:hydantoinase/oxoprolinase family protein [Candidatus Binatia bacterium]
HGTTVATNAILERKGARVGLLVTEGFQQILHLARSQTPGPLAGWMIMVKPDPLASLEDTRGVQERVDPQGRVVHALNEEKLQQVLKELRDRDVESLAVSLLHSYADPSHEERIREVATDVCPELPITLSSEILPEFREYERTQTAVVNAYIKPPVRRYLSGLQEKLKEAGLSATVSVLRSDSGLMTVEGACERPVYAVLSGPSGGVSGALFTARAAGFSNILTLDMGGTSTDVSLCSDGQPTLQRETQLDYHVVRAPAVDVRSVGAGGGSIASVPAITRALRVGPQSAGADPGPACYGRGAQEATVTDAHLVLGHLPSELLGGEMSLDVDAAHRAIEEIGQALGMDPMKAAEGIIAVTNEHMFGALRLVSVERGYDPRGFSLVAFGGAGPLHANFLARLLGSWPVLIPPSPGVLCALGNLCSDFRNEFARTFVRRLDHLKEGELNEMLLSLGEEAHLWLTKEGIETARQEIQYYADIRYYRQGLEVSLEVNPQRPSEDGTEELA